VRIIKLKKVKSVIATLLTTALILSSSSVVFASVNTNTATVHSFSKSTVITKDNIYEVLDYCGLDRSALKKDIDHKSFGAVTVGDLEDAINKAKKIPKMIARKDKPTNVESSSIGVTPNKITPMNTSTTGIETVAENSEAWIGGPIVRFSCSGHYYNDGTTKYWTSEAGGAGITMVSGQAGTTFYDIDFVNKLDTSVQDPSTSDSELVLDYGCQIGTYLGVKDLGSVEIYHNTIAGTNYYGSSYIN
jgi:hypothetical protein